MTNWQLGVGWDKRFSIIGINLHPEGEEASEARFYVPLGGLLKTCGITREEVLALFDQRYDWTEGTSDIEAARVRLLEETDWAGKTVLDLAGYSGEMAKMAVKGGAASVKVVDSEQWRIYGWPEPKPIPGVEFIKSSLYDWHEPADVVIFYNCLYHLPDPWRGLRHVLSLTKERMLLCTLFRYLDGPLMWLYNPRECNDSDVSVYFGPSLEALERLLRLTGWTAKQYALSYDRVLYNCEPTPGFVDAEEGEVRRVSSVGPQ